VRHAHGSGVLPLARQGSKDLDLSKTEGKT
jgi:hypothetical protein